MKRHIKSKRQGLKLGLIALASLVWLIIRTGRKPSRITYPCQKAAVSNMHLFLLVLSASLLDLKKLKATLPHALNRPVIKVSLVLGSLILAFGCTTFTANYPPSGGDYLFVPLDLKTHYALTSIHSSDLFFVQNASGTEGNLDAAVSRLLSMMQSHNLFFFKTSSQPTGLIGKNDVVLIKVNAVGPERAGTNTDLIKSLFAKILNHPEGFTGEIVVADNGQSTGGLDLAESNAYNHSQSIREVVKTFTSSKVSTWSWYTVSSNNVNEYDQGDYTDGYVVNSTENPTTHLHVSYPKFKTKYDTYISFKKGIWNATTNAYDSTRLKIINTPVLKSHSDYGVTACVKNYMGVASQDLTDIHHRITYGALGTEIAETRFPTLTILDAIWVNANPIESGSNCGPVTPYEAASYTNIIGASQDPVALEYWASKHILIPAAINKGHTAYSSLDPDYAPVAPGLTESYHNYLERSSNELKNAGYQVTMNETEMNTYIYPAKDYLAVRGLDDRIYCRSWNGTGWENWTVLPGSTVDSPAAAVLGNELHISVRGSDGHTLWHGYLTNPSDPNSFSGWTLLSGATPSAPTLTSNGTVLCLVVRGLDDRIYHRCYNGSWSPWHVVPTGTTCDSPAAAMLGNDLHIVVRGMDQSSLWDIIVSCDGAVVRNWGLLSGATPSKPVLASSGVNNLYLVVRGRDSTIYYRNYTASTDSWGVWNSLPGATCDGPAAKVMGNELCMVVRGLDGSTLWCGDIDLDTGNFFPGWAWLSGATPSPPTLAG